MTTAQTASFEMTTTPKAASKAKAKSKTARKAKQAKPKSEPKQVKVTPAPKAEPRAKAKAPKQAQPAPTADPTPATVPTPKPSDKGTFYLRVTTTRPSFAEQLPEGSFLRRDQPRRPGDTAKFRGVERERATLYRSRQQVSLKLAELASLYDGLAVEVVEG